jgi:hypothetical protein
MSNPVTYQLASDANYRFDIAKIGHHEYDQLSYYFKDDFPDVQISRKHSEIDIDRLESAFLWTVNGYVYNTARDSTSLYLPGAVSGMLRSRANKIGMLNFSGLTPQLKKQTLTADQISTDTNTAAYEKIFLTFTDPVLSPVLVLAGYLIFEHPEFFYRISDNTFALHLHRLNYMEKLYELFKYRDIFKDLGVPVSANNPTQVNTEDVRSTETIKRFLTLPNSFLVDTGNSNGLSRDPLYLEHSSIPGNFRTHKLPVLPMFVGYGKLTEYHKQQINTERYTVYCQDSVYHNYVFSAQNQHLLKTYNGHRIPGTTYRISNAFFLDIRANP